MGKVYDAKALFDVAKDREKAYDELLSQLGELKKALQGVADLEGSLEGKGADNIKSFYKQHADTAGQWENLIKMQQSYFSTLHVKAEKAKLSGSTIVDESFLETELKNANSNAKEMVAQQHDDLQSILNGIDDIVSISAFSTSEFNDKIEEAEKKRTDTIEAMNQLDAEWSKEYSEMDDFYAVVDMLVSGLELATSQGGSVYQLAFDEKAYHDSELYKVQTKLNDYATSYVDYNKQQEEVYELEKKQEEEANKPWYEKTWDAVSTFTGEVSGYYDYKRAAEGVDPVTGEKLSTSQRVAAGAMAAAGFIPVVGWVGRAAKGGKAIYKTAKGLSAADHALDAYKSAKSFKVLEQTEKGLYGLVAANGLGEYMTGRDMFGNKISEEQRKASLLQALGIAGAGALSTKVAGKTAKAGANAVANGAKKLSDMRNSLRTEVITNRARSAYQSVQKSSPSWTQSLKKTYNNILDSNMPRLMPELAPLGPDLGQRTVRETLQNSKNYVMQKAEKVSAVSKVTSEVTPKKKSLPDWLKDRWQAGNNFNKENRPRYPYNEVELEAKEVGGKKYVVDSYAPNKEIVSRKFTQLSEVQEKTAKSYLNEITKKYSSGSKISNSTFNPNALKGGRLKGELILEVPVQNKTIPQTILDEATKNRIVIRDIKGKVYN
ncbi:ribonuclease YeeF family protein [Priestia megaterium]|uniref:Pre-toxin TG family protein n=1 Tax=Priestia megaterium (strain ATCC 14581 / DSM 32 / CCUG 1817 / JCM 2506 / NBRC 15308 / NCIMB 9376 / NCTC 10342 / NRRL B-14308 / VKM B-512 / Ford 19) TaxID=1348623 RepID=A0A0B6AFA4_PRIM2|nr:T7SS effector LXG polymorphic toxin [Priestia megaterium]AJI22211.1 pre-toxin TG family protein [Priestia megaterium NBRC 15308 = ATCC 14581]KFM98019.1 pre-toxin TG family protein [Priestia megaterium]KGJ84718.1 transposase [Priestia megaterium NBRC 15308 = ATCC 14581]MED3808955.1 T7SS effector LXG polymorphic toxin [Priestia megaterium]MED4398272.1 T7SS effector LXG polymorphic toxin [Priestia megaterium]